jgi:hypothetical protein
LQAQRREGCQLRGAIRKRRQPSLQHHEDNKRVMAAEFSRELGVKVHGGLCRTASFGYRAGGSLTFGLGRELVDGTTQRPKGRLVKGEYKALKTDRVRLQFGSDEEIAVVRWIFQQFVLERKSDVEIARQLNRSKIPNHHGRCWSYIMVLDMLKNENYIGNLVYNRTSRRLGQKQVNNPHHLWIRTPVLSPVVDPDLFGDGRIRPDGRVRLGLDASIAKDSGRGTRDMKG